MAHISKEHSDAPSDMLLSIALPAPKRSKHEINRACHKMTKILNGNGILTPLYHYRVDPEKKERTKNVLIWSHGNGEDICEPNHIDPFGKQLECDVIAYDYYGYGCTYGHTLSEENCVKSLRNVVSYALEEGYHAENITLYGRSIGSAVTSAYISEHPDSFGNVIFDSPMTSAKGFIEPLIKGYSEEKLIGKVDMFETYDKHLDNINAPLLIIHGRDDTLVPIDHSFKIYDRYKKAHEKRGKKVHQPIWVRGAGHNDIFRHYGFTNYCKKLREFMNYDHKGAH